MFNNITQKASPTRSLPTGHPGGSQKGYTGHNPQERGCLVPFLETWEKKGPKRENDAGRHGTGAATSFGAIFFVPTTYPNPKYGGLASSPKDPLLSPHSGLSTPPKVLSYKFCDGDIVSWHR